MKKIKGYRLIKPQYEKVAALIVTDNYYETLSDGVKTIINAERDINALKQAGVLDLWFEPVYETLTICGKDVIRFDEIIVMEKDTAYRYDFFKSLLTLKNFQSIRFSIDGVTEDVTLKKINQILEL